MNHTLVPWISCVPTPQKLEEIYGSVKQEAMGRIDAVLGPDYRTYTSIERADILATYMLQVLDEVQIIEEQLRVRLLRDIEAAKSYAVNYESITEWLAVSSGRVSVSQASDYAFLATKLVPFLETRDLISPQEFWGIGIAKLRVVVPQLRHAFNENEPDAQAIKGWLFKANTLSWRHLRSEASKRQIESFTARVTKYDHKYQVVFDISEVEFQFMRKKLQDYVIWDIHPGKGGVS